MQQNIRNQFQRALGPICNLWSELYISSLLILVTLLNAKNHILSLFLKNYTYLSLICADQAIIT